jgi:hypothetical protein
MNDLRDRARRAFYAIKRNIKFNILIRIWLEVLESVIEPFALYGCEVWGPLTIQEFTKWDKHQIETRHADFCKTISSVYNAKHQIMHAELGRYPLIFEIQKRGDIF